MAMTLAFPAASGRSPARMIAAVLAVLAVLALAVLGARALVAQVSAERGIAPVAVSRDINVGGIKVDVRGDNAQAAREKGWEEAARLGWQKLGGPAVSDGELSSLVSAIVVESEQIGPRRYIATLGVVFDRQRAASYLGGDGKAARSAPLLLVPVQISGGVATVYETRNPWQRAWAEFQAGSGRIDYVRASGAGGDSLLVTAGQTGRRSRTWWRTVLDTFGASDVLIPVAHLQHRYPGGPIDGTFTARYGPDNRFLESFRLTAANDAALPAMLGDAVQRIDAIYGRALADGLLAPDPTLEMGAPQLDPAIAALVEYGRAAQAQDRAAAAAATERARRDAAAAAGPETSAEPARAAVPVQGVTIQAATPDAAAADTILGAIRGAAGVRAAATSSLALGGTSVFSVMYAGEVGALADALRARGLTVSRSGNILSVSR